VESPTDREWDQYLADIGVQLPGVDAIFSTTAGGGPNAEQRARSVAFWKAQSKQPRIAVLTPSRLVVRMVGALRWFMPSQIKAFNDWDVDSAYGYLGLGPTQRTAVGAAVDSLRIRLGIR
jgi:hypothetical protein